MDSGESADPITKLDVLLPSNRNLSKQEIFVFFTLPLDVHCSTRVHQPILLLMSIAFLWVKTKGYAS